MTETYENIHSSTDKIDGLRGSISEQLIRNTEAKYNAICEVSSRDQLRGEIHKCFPSNTHKIIRDFFTAHPVSWTDLLRKIFALKKYNNTTKKWHINEADYGEIYASFLIRGRKNDIGTKIRGLLPTAISENQDLLSFAGAQPSLLDEGGYMFSKISAKNRKGHIKKLIVTGMLQNIDNCTYENTEEHMQLILPKLLRYIKEIFGKELNLSYCKTLDELIKRLEKMFASGHGEQRENAFRVIQSFHAWANIEEIEKFHALALEKIEYMPKKLNEMGIGIDGKITTMEHNDAIIHMANVSFEGKTYKIEWRVKTVKSILQKMSETEEYTNKDAIRDMIGINFIWPNNTSSDDKTKIVVKFGKIMPDFGYLLKNRGLLDDTSVKNIETELKKNDKNPVHITSKRNETTTDAFNENASLSGFMSLGGEALGTEVQFASEAFSEWKKEDDKIYKPRGMIILLMRGPKFSTPKDCYMLLNERIKPARLKELNLQTINDLLLLLIEKEKFIIPYISPDGGALLFTTKAYRGDFISKFPTMQKCEVDHQFYYKMRNYVSDLK